MNDSVLRQLHELAGAFNKIGLQPVICGGLGIYLRFSSREREFELRATNDIDLMLTGNQVQNQTNREAILKAIKDDLKYVVRKDAQHFMFERSSQDKLDILIPPIDRLEVDGFRVKLVRSQLHGYLTPEAVFIEEDLDVIRLHDVFSSECNCDCSIQLPSITNLLILKLFAFEDRHKRGNEERGDTERAQSHAYDVFVIAELSNSGDYLKNREFLSRHKDSEIIHKAQSIVSESFSEPSRPGWQYVPSTSIYPELKIEQRIQRLEHAARRLVRWFEI